MSDALERLADLAGLISSYTDAWGHRRVVPEATRRAILAAMGIAADNENAIEASIRALEDRAWRRPLEPVIVTRRGRGGRISIPLVLESARDGETLAWRMEMEHGEGRDGTSNVAELPLSESRTVNGTDLERRLLALPFAVPHGYHEFRLFPPDSAAGKEPVSCSVIVAPRECYLPPSLEQGHRAWGYTVQLYSLRSSANWGIGDFSDLRILSGVAARQGAAAIGINPLHAMFPENPAHASPYSPSHREFLADFYIDPEAVPDLSECGEARELIRSAAFQEKLAALRVEQMVDYERVADLKRPVMELLYRSFREHHLGPPDTAPRSDRGAAFRRYQMLRGEQLEKLGRFQALAEHFSRDMRLPEWPEAFRDAESDKVEAFASEHRDRVEFFQYLQWIGDQQLAAANEEARQGSAGIGLYQDLALAPDRSGAEYWSDRGIFASGVTLGAPPDDWNLKGQNWGLPPYSPTHLREAGYRPFIEIIRANMQHAGALRLDHAMWLERMYWIPEGMSAHDGGYLRYPTEDLMGILALESQRQRCLVIAEDLGTVPDNFREKLRNASMLSYRLLYFEQDDEGEFMPPEDYIARAAVAVNTHDLATLPGFWKERDLAVRAELGLYPSEQARDDSHRRRARERRALLHALKRENILSPDFPEDVEAFSFELATAVYRFLARTPSLLLLVSIEDVFGQLDQANLPGTTFEHPNWKRRLEVELDRFVDDSRMIAIAAAVGAERGEREATGAGEADE